MNAVFFDVDDTLIDYASKAQEALDLAIGDRADFAAWLALSDPHFRRWELGEVGFEQMRVERMAGYLEYLGVNDDPEAAERRRFEHLWTEYQVFPDVLPVLDVLRAAGLRLGLITNNESVHQRHKLTSVGLLARFDAVIISDEVGVAKPTRRIFELACDAIGVPAVDCLHVGDRLDFDAVAATEAGLRGVWLDRARSGLAADVPVVTSLAELPELLR